MGRVLGYLSPLEGANDAARPENFPKPTVIDRLWDGLRKNSLWLLVGETSAMAATLAAQTVPEALVPLGLLIAGGIAAHLGYQYLPVLRKS